MPSYRDVVPGQVYGRCTVLQTNLFIRDTSGRSRYTCIVRCVCGTIFERRIETLLRDHTASCGCFKREILLVRNFRHGASNTPLYRMWTEIKRRCNTPKNTSYANYGGRGITVCPAWDTSFEAFCTWAMAHGYEPGLTIERQDVHGNYEPENCCFIPMARQAANKRTTRLVSCWGETHTVADWGRDPRCVVSAQRVYARLNKGWTPEAALTQPASLANQPWAILVTCFDETKSVMGWSRDPRCIVQYNTLWKRIKNGWPPEQALTIPSRWGNRWLHLSQSTRSE